MTHIPEHLGGLTLTKQLGSGKLCEVWEARESGSGKHVAVKVVVPEAARDRSQRRQLQHELRVARAVHHPSIIRIDRLGESSGLPYLVMDFCPYPNLKRQIVTDHAAVLQHAQTWSVAMALALAHMHQCGWVHRDVKPDNVLGAPDGQIVLIDLAIATRLPGWFSGVLRSRRPAQGSPSYMPPEQIRGQPVDGRADIYSLGCLIFELLGGRPPFTATHTNDLLNKHITAPPPAVDALNPAVTAEASRLLRQMMAKQPAQRPATMQDVVQQVRRMRFFDRDPHGA